MQLEAWKGLSIDILRDVDPLQGQEDFPRLDNESTEAPKGKG